MAIYFNNHANPESITYERFSESVLDREWPDRVIAFEKNGDGRIVWEKEDSGSSSYKNLGTIIVSFSDSDRKQYFRNIEYKYTSIDPEAGKILYVYKAESTLSVGWEELTLLGVGAYGQGMSIKWLAPEPSGISSASGVPDGLSFYRAITNSFGYERYRIKDSPDSLSDIKTLQTSFEVNSNEGIIVETKYTTKEYGKLIYTHGVGVITQAYTVTLYLKKER